MRKAIRRAAVITLSVLILSGCTYEEPEMSSTSEQTQGETQSENTGTGTSDTTQQTETTTTAEINPESSKNAIKVEGGEDFCAVLYDDGTVGCKGTTYTDVVDIAASQDDLVLVKADGTVQLITVNYESYPPDFSNLNNIKAVSCNNDWQGGVEYSFLKNDGTVIGYANSFQGTAGWSDIVQIDNSSNSIVGLKSDGTVVVAIDNYDHGQGQVSGFSNIVKAVEGGGFSLGITDQGTVVTTAPTSSDLVANQYLGQINGWTEIKDASAGLYFVIGLKNDGTVVTAGADDYQFNTSNWSGIVDVDAGPDYVIGLKQNGETLQAKK